MLHPSEGLLTSATFARAARERLRAVPGRAESAWLGVVAVALCSKSAYRRVLSNGFVDFDDNLYAYDNAIVKQGLTLENVRWAFGFPAQSHGFTRIGTYWHPLTWLSLMLDADLGRLDPAWVHAGNVALHAGVAALLFLVLRAATGRFGRSLAVAVLFAVHPLNVESVAWAAERKTPLAHLFFMLALLGYMRFAQRPSIARYAVVLAAFALALLAKPVTATLPLLLLLFDVWPLARVPWLAGRRPENPRFAEASVLESALEKLPLFVMSATAVILSIRSIAGWNPLDDRNILPWSEKLANAAAEFFWYAREVALPIDLACYHPARLGAVTGLVLAAAVAGLAVVTAALVAFARRAPWLLFGTLWYVIALAPVSGLVRNGLWPAVADRFAYLPMIGLLVVLVWGAAAVLERRARGAEIGTGFALAAATAACVACARQVGG